MANRTIGKEISRGTICKDRFRADVTVVVSDQIPQGQASQMLVDVKFRRAGGGLEVALVFRPLTSPAHGEIRFDGADGPTTKTFNANARELLVIHGKSASAGSAQDVVLDVKIDGEVRESIPLSVRPAVGITPTVAVRAENGVDPAPDSVLFEVATRFRATVAPATPGTFRWFSVREDALEIKGDAGKEVVEVVGHRVPGASRTLCVLFTQQNGPAIMAVHSLRPRYQGRIEDRSAAPEFGEAATGHRFLPVGTPFTIVDRNGAVVFSGSLDAAGRFLTTFALEEEYELRVAGYEGLST